LLEHLALYVGQVQLMMTVFAPSPFQGHGIGRFGAFISDGFIQGGIRYG
jgi:hypothetical protein